MHEIGDLVLSSTGHWMVRAAEFCRNRHVLQGNCLVGTAVCACRDRHLTWCCNACGDVIYGPALGPHCSLLNGPAAVR